jgi:hypothetical protein
MQKEDEGAASLFILFLLHEENWPQKLTDDVATSKEVIQKVSVNVCILLIRKLFSKSLLSSIDMNL